jgi:ferritin
MLNPKMQDALNEQLNRELYSSYLYLSMSAYFDSVHLLGFAGWMRVQAQEEIVHALKYFDYVKERGGRTMLAPVEGPPTEWESSLPAFEQAYEHEVEVTARINGLVDLAIQLSDHAASNFLQWFVAEQVEEEASVDTVVQRLKLVGSDSAGLFMLDAELGKRIFVLPPAAAV